MSIDNDLPPRLTDPTRNTGDDFTQQEGQEPFERATPAELDMKPMQGPTKKPASEGNEPTQKAGKAGKATRSTCHEK
jgi:hypothetical protein